jgi:pilus assembly protein CpaB
MGRRAALLIAAVLIAATGTALILLYVQGIDARAAEGQEQVQVLTATELIDTGERMSEAQEAGKIVNTEVARDDVVAGAVSSAESLADQVALAPIYPGEQILPQKFGQPGKEEALSIPDDRIAISVNLTDPARVAGFVNPGSRVAIFVSADPKLLKDDGTSQELPAVTRVLLPNVQVVGVGQTTVQTTTTKNEEGKETTEEIPRAILTIAVSQDEAEKVIFGARNGELAFALRTDKSDVTDSPGVTANEVLPESFESAPGATQ